MNPNSIIRDKSSTVSFLWQGTRTRRYATRCGCIDKNEPTKYNRRMNFILEKIWKVMGSFLRWHVIWLMNDKFFVGVAGVVLNNENQIILLRNRLWKDG